MQATMQTMSFSKFRLSDQGSIQSSPVRGYTLSVDLNSRHQVVVTLVNKLGSQQLTVEKIPDEVRKSKEILYEFLRDAYIRVVPLSGGETKIYVHHRLRGGGLGNQGTIDLGLLQQAIQHAKKAQHKDVIAFLGNTGSGKSTIVDHLLGVPLRMEGKEPWERKIVSADPNIEPAKIGHFLTRSQTLFTEVYPTTTEGQVLADCGGFFDTRGATASLVVPLSIVYTLRNARSVKLVLCITYKDLCNSRGQFLGEQLKTVCGRLIEPSHRRAVLDNLLILVTKGNQEERFPTIEEVRTQIQEQVDEMHETHPLAYVYKQILEGARIQLYDPTSETSRSNAIAYLSRRTPIQVPQNAFMAPYTRDSEDALMGELAAITRDVKGSYTQYNGADEDIAWIKKRIQQEEQELEGIARTLDELANKKATPEKATPTNIENDKKEVQAIQEQLHEIGIAITLAEVALRQHQAFGETEDPYMSLPVDPNNPDVVIKGKPERRIDWYGGVVPVGFIVDEPSIIGYRQPLHYQGPPITKVMHYPTRHDLSWVEENQDLDQGIYAITYDGKDSQAKIEIYTKRKHFPGYKEQLDKFRSDSGQLKEDRQRLVDKLNAVTQSLDDYQTALIRLQEGQQQTQYFENRRDLLTRHMEILQSQRRSLEKAKHLARDKMKEDAQRMQFLHDFLSLCSVELRSHEMFEEFIKFYERYCQIMQEGTTT